MNCSWSFCLETIFLCTLGWPRLAYACDPPVLISQIWDYRLVLWHLIKLTINCWLRHPYISAEPKKKRYVDISMTISILPFLTSLPTHKPQHRALCCYISLDSSSPEQIFSVHLHDKKIMLKKTGLLTEGSFLIWDYLMIFLMIWSMLWIFGRNTEVIQSFQVMATRWDYN